MPFNDSARRSRAWLLAGAASLLIAFGTAGCASSQHPHAVALLDTTGSTAGGTVALCRTHLDRWAHRVATQQGDLRADVLNAGTAGQETWPVHAAFTIPAADQSSVEAIDEDVAQQLRHFDGQLDALLAANPSHGPTPFVAALYGAGQYLAVDHGPKLLWVCSDGRDSRLPETGLTVGKVDAVLAHMTAQDLPDLDGVDVWVDTVTVRGRAGLGVSGQKALEHFVRELVRRAHGRVRGYGPYAGT